MGIRSKSYDMAGGGSSSGGASGSKFQRTSGPGPTRNRLTIRVKNPRARAFIEDTMHVTPWTVSALALLLVGGLVFMIAFLTNGWGRLRIADVNYEDYWEFGLWQCCRQSDRTCIGPRWPTFYTSARMCGVLAILTNALTFGWLLGYTLEKLLEYDPCTVSCLISLNAVTVFFNITTVCLFGIWWPKEFHSDLHGTSPTLYYAFYMACMTMTFNIAAEVLLIIELITSRRQWLAGPPRSAAIRGPEEPLESDRFLSRLTHLRD